MTSLAVSSLSGNMTRLVRIVDGEASVFDHTGQLIWKSPVARWATGLNERGEQTVYLFDRKRVVSVDWFYVKM